MAAHGSALKLKRPGLSCSSEAAEAAPDRLLERPHACRRPRSRRQRPAILAEELATGSIHARRFAGPYRRMAGPFDSRCVIGVQLHHTRIPAVMRGS